MSIPAYHDKCRKLVNQAAPLNSAADSERPVATDVAAHVSTIEMGLA